jgi:hypothetical protein
MKKQFLFPLSVGVLLLAGYGSDKVHTIESMDGRTTLTEKRGNKVISTWELKLVVSVQEKHHKVFPSFDRT